MNGQCVVSCFLGRGILHGHLLLIGFFWLRPPLGSGYSNVPQARFQVSIIVKLLLGAGERDQLTVSFLGFTSTIRYE
jgi:hypothetical protein